jgi:hypothetical protein
MPVVRSSPQAAPWYWSSERKVTGEEVGNSCWRQIAVNGATNEAASSVNTVAGVAEAAIRPPRTGPPTWRPTLSFTPGRLLTACRRASPAIAAAARPRPTRSSTRRRPRRTAVPAAARRQPPVPSPYARRRICGQQRRGPAVPQHAAGRRRLRLTGTSMTGRPSDADAHHGDGARSAPVVAVACHAKPSGSVKGSLPPAMTIRCEPVPSAETPASSAAARRL